MFLKYKIFLIFEGLENKRSRYEYTIQTDDQLALVALLAVVKDYVDSTTSGLTGAMQPSPFPHGSISLLALPRRPRNSQGSKIIFHLIFSLSCVIFM